MFFRYTQGGARKPVDLDDFYAGQSLFLLGGSPTLREMNLSQLRCTGVVTMGMNNVPYVFTPNLWVCADKPPCFSPHIYASPEMTKFTIISRRDEIVPGTEKRVRDMPSTLFFGTRDDVVPATFLDRSRSLVWWKSVFPIALQLAWKLGFRTVYLVGCGFRVTPERAYAWDAKLSDYQKTYSQRTYSQDVDRLKELKPYFDARGFSVVSCTPDSAANDILGYLPLDAAVARVVRQLPPIADTMHLVHSSALSAKEASK